MQIFARLTKVDEARRTVSGIIANEALDRSGEVFDYVSSKPYFDQWSAGIAKATDGKSVGNVRAMHSNVAAGKLNSMDMDDAAKTITVNAKIVDDNEWTKVQEGVYTGFSIGGKYAKQWQDGDTKRYTAEPYEVSLVDLPCNPDAMFTVVKADGAEEMRKFATTTDDDALAKWLDANVDAVEKAIARRKDTSPSKGSDFADTTNQKYPLDTAAHVRAAWSYIHMPKNAAKYSAKDVAAIKARIVAAWKKKIDPQGPPEAKKFEGVAETLVKRAEVQAIGDAANVLLGNDPVDKGLWAVSQLAQLMEQLYCIADGVDAEQVAESDDSDIGTTFRAALAPLARAFLQMAQEETQEAAHGEMNDQGAIANAAAGDLAKVADDLVKVIAERDELVKGMQDIRAELERIRALPAAPKGALRVVEKRLGTEPPAPDIDETPVKGDDGNVDHLATAQKLAKLAYRRPVRDAR